MTNLAEVQAIVGALSARHDSAEVVVLADWFEERQIMGFAAALRPMAEDLPLALAALLPSLARAVDGYRLWAYRGEASWIEASFVARGLCGDTAQKMPGMACRRHREHNTRSGWHSVCGYGKHRRVPFDRFIASQAITLPLPVIGHVGLVPADSVNSDDKRTLLRVFGGWDCEGKEYVE